MNNIMLDLETLGNGGKSAIISIGAVRFNEQVTDKFYEVISLESCLSAGLEIDASTVMWWMKQSDEARAQFNSSKAISLEECLIKFSSWIGKDAKVWGNGASFDNAILSNAYRKIGLKQPWKFTDDYCYRTVKNMNKHIKLERVGVYHCAVDDAESQALHLIQILKSKPVSQNTLTHSS